MPTYSFVLEDGNWIYYIQGEKMGSSVYIPPMEYYKEEVEAYNIDCPESWFFTEKFCDIFFCIEKLQEEGKIGHWYMTYDKETNTYEDDGRCPYSVVGVSNTKYDIIVKGVKIGSFTLD